MLKRTHAIAAVVIVALVSCHRLSREESKLIGTWEFTTMDAVGREQYDADHKFFLYWDAENIGQPGFHLGASGTWRLEGRTLVTEYDDKVLLDKDPPIKPQLPKKTTRRLDVRDFRDDEIIFDRATSLHRVK